MDMSTGEVTSYGVARAFPGYPSKGGATVDPPAVRKAGGPPSLPSSDAPEKSLLFSIHESKDRDGCGISTYERPGGSACSVGLEPAEGCSEALSGGFSGVESEAFQGLSLAETLRRITRYERAVGNRSGMVEFLRSRGDLGQVGKVPTAVRAANLGRCGDWLEFHQFITLPGAPTRLAKGMFCQQPLLCQMDALRRSAKLLRRYFPKLLTAIRAGMVPYFSTWSVPSGPDLRTQLELMRSHLRGMLRDSWEHRRGRLKRFEPASAFAGSVLSLEIKRGEGTRSEGGWHVHAHGLLLADRSVDGEAVKRAWCERTQCSVMAAQYLEPLKSVAGPGGDVVSETLLESDVARDLCEVFKYPMKFTSMSEADRWEAFEVVSGKMQLLNASGCLRGVELDDDQAGDDWDPLDLPYLTVLLRFDAGTGRYAAHGTGFVGGSENE